jgi:hypothetical protein
MLLEPLPHGIRQVHGLSTKMNPGQAMHAFEVLDHVSAIRGIADLWDAEKPKQFLFRHDGGTGEEFTRGPW